MGGRAFSHVEPSIRLDTGRFDPIVRAVATNVGGRVVRWLGDKPSHGDADVVVDQSVVDRLGDDALAFLVGQAVGVDVIRRRPDVRDPILFVGLRLPEGLFQVDLIASPDDLSDFAACVLSWGDLGTMIGRIAREMGMTFGQNGLRLPVRVPGVQAESVLLCGDFDEAMDLLGYDAAVHRAGFADQKASVEFLASGRFFDPKVFDPARASSEARRLARRRPDRPELVAEIMAHPGRFAFPELRADETFQSGTIAQAVARFGKAGEIAAAVARMEEIAAMRPEDGAFSMEAVQAVTGLEGRDLRAIVVVMAESFPEGNAFPKWRSTSTPEDVEARALAAMPILADRRAAEARRAAVAEQHRRNREAKTARRAADRT